MRLRRLFPLATLCLLLTGCVGTPPSSSDGAGEVVVTGSRVDEGGGDGWARKRVSAPAPAAPAPPPSVAMARPSPEPAMSAPPAPSDTLVAGVRSQPPAQAGLLTAGDHDDLLNPVAYAEYVGRYLQQTRDETMPYVDTARRFTVAVVDPSGAPMPFARVSIRRPQGALTLTTLADGTVGFFPAFDKLPERLEMTITSPGGTDVTRIATTTEVMAARRYVIKVDEAAAKVAALDLLLVVDTTGSMGDELNYLKAELTSILDEVGRRNPGVSVRVGLIAYRDAGDEYVVRAFAFTGDVPALLRDLAKQFANGGGDYPEAMDEALAKALTYDWRPRAARVMLLVADAPPHDPKITASWKLAADARLQGVQIVPVAASGVADKAQFLMRAMAALTQSRYLFLTDDSGVGNAHAEPSVDCYVVTRLDGLVVRVLSGMISGRRIEPEAGQVIRTVGDYDKGVCRGQPRKPPAPLADPR